MQEALRHSEAAAAAAAAAEQHAPPSSLGWDLLDIFRPNFGEDLHNFAGIEIQAKHS